MVFSLTRRTLSYFCRENFHTEAVSLSAQKFFYNSNFINEKPLWSVIEILQPVFEFFFLGSDLEDILLDNRGGSKASYLHGLIKETIPWERRCFDGRLTSKQRFADASKQAVFPFKLIDNFFKEKESNIKVTDPALSF